MNRLLLLVPLLAVVGCQPSSPTTPPGPGTTTAAARTDPGPAPRTVATTGPVKATTPPAWAGSKDEPPPFRPAEIEEPKEDPPEDAPPVPESFTPLNKDKTVFFEKAAGGARRVHLMAAVCLREGPLEVLVCKFRSKEHESILHVDADGRAIHAALIAAGAQPGSPVRFVNPKTGNPEYKAATGTRIKVSLTYREKGKVKTVPAGEWIADKKTGKDMAYDWVFAGSKFFKDPENPDAEPYYMANNGEFISLANFPDSMLDLPVKSPKEAADLIFEINTPRIPPLRTPVIVTLEPVVEKKK